MNDTLLEIRKQTVLAEQSAKAATGAAKTAQDALNASAVQFRYDQRPYIAIAPVGQVASFTVSQVGPHSGHLMMEFHLKNYGKSPALEFTRDARIAVGEDDWKRMRTQNQVAKYERIIPPGDTPSIFAYSDRTMSPQLLSDIQAGRVPVIIFGHVEYTDIFGDPKPMYMTAFCTPMAAPGRPGDTNDDCKDQNYIK